MRKQVSSRSEVAAFEAFKRAMQKAKGEKGIGGFASTHEILGVIEEEYHELQHAVKDNDPSEVEAELLDILVASFWGIASMKSGSLDW